MYSKLVTTAVLAAGLASAQAAVHFDIDVINTVLDGTTPTYSSTFDITGPGLGKGYDPVTMTIESAFATFSLFDPTVGGGTETVTIELGGEAFSSVGPFLGVLTLGDEILGNVLLDLDQDGVLGYTVNRGAGSFKLVGAELHAKSSDRPTRVPDSGWSLALLGLSVAGVARFRK